MESLIKVPGLDWNAAYTPERQLQVTQGLENGKIILFPELAFPLEQAEKVFLSPSFSNLKSKNISYSSATGLVRGTPYAHNPQLKALLARYAQYTTRLMHQLFPAYISGLQVGRTSFRPVEILGRKPKSYRKDDTRLHVDAFPTSPLQGKRILRVFTNINPHGQERVWRIGEPFAEVARQFYPTTRKAWWGRSKILQALKITKSYCTEYDYLMLQIHNHMKKDTAYQKSAAQQEVRFAPGSSWIVQTDHVSHAAMSGQYVLEQTFYLPVNAMSLPELSPLRVLEKITGRALV